MPIPATDEEIALWIKAFQARSGYSPTIREMCEAFGWRSSSTGHVALGRLIKKGFVKVVKPARRELLVTLKGSS